MTTPMPTGFILKKLILDGTNVPEAQIQFSRGLNVVAGPSDTGKTFIADCIDFMFGASTPPKRIPEAEGYDTARILVEKIGGGEFLLERSLSGGAFRLQQNGATITLCERHIADSENTVSHFFLSLIGLIGKKVRTNARGTTRSLSFRDLARLIIVREEDVISERSPVLSGQHSSQTGEISVFRLILTGMDDSSIIAQEEPKVARSKQEGKQEILMELLDKNSRDIGGLSIDELEPEQVSCALEEVERLIAVVTEELSSERASALTLEEERRAVWQALRQVESHASVVEELQRRFELLQTQYISDLRRLEAIVEVGVRLAQMTEERCPVCGAVAEHHNHEHRKAQVTPNDVVVSCGAEAEKIQLLLRDLSVTIANNAQEINQLAQQAEQHRVLLQATQSRLSEEMQPRIAELLSQLQSAESRRTILNKLTDLYCQREEFSEMLDEALMPIRRTSRLPSSSVGNDQAEAFCISAEELLRNWNFPNLGRVTFSEDDQDLVIGSRKRISYGKGVRALTHAAFSLALLRNSRRKERPHPGLVIIDSPLVVYREPEPSDDGVAYDVKDSFYRGIASDFSSDQVIILENEDPPEDLERANVIVFTGTDSGRFGFLPRRQT